MKQKTILLTTVLGLTVGLVSAIFVASLPESTAYAQGGDPCSSEVIPEDWTGSTGDGTREACSEAVTNGEDPCKAMYTYLQESGNAEGSAAARDVRNSCEDVVGGPCSTAVIPEGTLGRETRDACYEAVDNNKDPCDAIYDTVLGDDRFSEEDAAERRNNCEDATGTAPDCRQGDPNCCGGVKTSIISGDMCNEEGEGGVIFGLLKWVLGIMTAGVGIAAVGGIGYGAFLYTTAENKPEQTKKAIGIITNVMIGVLAYALMYLFLNFLIPGGIFGA